jgi:hypothetical protein
MFDQGSTGAGAAFALIAALMATTGSGAGAADDAKYPNWKGQWAQILTPGVGGQNVRFDPTKAFGPAQQAPLTPEYQKVQCREHGGPGEGRARQLPDRALPTRRHAAHDDGGVGICDHAGNNLLL